MPPSITPPPLHPRVLLPLVPIAYSHTHTCARMRAHWHAHTHARMRAPRRYHIAASTHRYDKFSDTAGGWGFYEVLGLPRAPHRRECTLSTPSDPILPSTVSKPPRCSWGMVCMRACARARVSVCMRHTYTQTNRHTSTRTHAHTHVCTHACTHARAHTHMAGADSSRVPRPRHPRQRLRAAAVRSIRCL